MYFFNNMIWIYLYDWKHEIREMSTFSRVSLFVRMSSPFIVQAANSVFWGAMPHVRKLRFFFVKIKLNIFRRYHIDKFISFSYMCCMRYVFQYWFCFGALFEIEILYCALLATNHVMKTNLGYSTKWLMTRISSFLWLFGMML